jgi:hypothetical protein
MAIEVPAVLQAFGTWYNDAPGVPAGTTFVHLAGLLWSGGLAVAADRTMLRTPLRDAAARATTLATVRGTHRAVVTGLVFVALSGLAMAAADAETYLVSPVFWIKMALVATLATNGLVMLRAESRAAGDVRAWGRLRLTAGISLACWFVLVLLGVLLVNSA